MIINDLGIFHPFPMKYLSKSGPEFGKPKNVADVASEFDAGDGTGASRPDVLTRQSQQARLNLIHPRGHDPQMTEFAIFNLMKSNEHTHTHIYIYCCCTVVVLALPFSPLNIVALAQETCVAGCARFVAFSG